MTDADLFEDERLALEAALAIQCQPGVSADEYREALHALSHQFQRLLRETSRLIRHSDRAERETNRLNRELQELTAQLRYRATHDPLTGILNRAAIIDNGGRLLAESDVALIVLDVDLFKRINDTFGHPAGDMVLRELAACLNAVVNDTEKLGRVGGEEFTVLMPECSPRQALDVAERIRACIEQHVFEDPIGRSVTASLGVSWNPCGSSFDDAYGKADGALYQAKRQGRNCVVACASV